jgi:hypothetical protein
MRTFKAPSHAHSYNVPIGTKLLLRSVSGRFFSVQHMKSKPLPTKGLIWRRQQRKVVQCSLAREVGDPRYGVGSQLEYEARFYSTLPDTWSNKLRVATGQMPQSTVIADRAFNAK